METSTNQDLIDQGAIQHLRFQFAQALDHQDWSLLQSLFTPTVEADYSDYGMAPQTLPSEQLVAIFRHAFSLAGMRTQHQSTNFRIQVAGNKATSVSNFTGHHYLPGQDGGEEFTLFAEYTDQLTRSEGKWLLSAVRLKVFFTSGNPKVLAS